MIPDFRRLNPSKDFGYGYGHPQPLPSTKATSLYNSGPDNKIYQGRRWKNDEKRVFNRNFQKADVLPDQGQLYHCDVVFNCVISYLSVESRESIPILLRGGVGYNFLNVVVRAKPNKKLKGRIQVFCRGKGPGGLRTNDVESEDNNELRELKENVNVDKIRS